MRYDYWKSRQELINELVADDINTIRQNMFQSDYEYLDRILRLEGWTPYQNRTIADLKQEYIERGL